MRRILCASIGTLALACASDVWFKPGAGPDALARDKAACREQVATRGLDAFEACMAERDWWHGGRGAEPPALAAEEAYVARPASEMDPSPSEVSPSSTRSASSRGPTRTARPRASADPSRRQFWFKLGAGTDRLAVDQAACRSELGLEPDAASPSRWGERTDFDRCMRARGWTGGSIEAP